jgi:hypothetical protein
MHLRLAPAQAHFSPASFVRVSFECRRVWTDCYRRLRIRLVQISFFDSVHPSPLMPKVGHRPQICHPGTGFPTSRHHPRPHMRLSVESRTKFASATKLERKSAVAQGRDLQFHSDRSQMPTQDQLPSPVLVRSTRFYAINSICSGWFCRQNHLHTAE